MIIADFLLGLFITDWKVPYIFSFQSFITYMSVIPLMLVNFEVITDKEIIKWGFLYSWRVLRFYSILRLAKMFTRQSMQVQFVMFMTAWQFFNMQILYGSLFLTAENMFSFDIMEEELKNRQLTPGYENDTSNLEDRKIYVMHEMLYYMVVTMSTVGYGDIYPYSIPGQWVVILVIFSFMSFVNTLFSGLTKIAMLTSEFTRSQYEKTGINVQHILLLGEA